MLMPFESLVLRALMYLLVFCHGYGHKDTPEYVKKWYKEANTVLGMHEEEKCN